jgi:membrane protein CcdC involved in cytochrome C biogenesis
MLVSAVVGAIVIVLWRVRETQRPVTAAKIVVPPLAMSTGLSMFVYPPTRIPVTWGLGAFVVGAALLAIPLIRTSRLTLQGDVVMLKRSRAFLWILLGLVIVRLAARAWVEQYVTPLQTGAVFFLLALGMIVRWRVTMLVEYRALVRGHGEAVPSSSPPS